MKLRVLLPTHVEVEKEADRVSAEGLHGSFTLLPKHIDCTVPLVPSVLSYTSENAVTYLAVDGGILVKCGGDVSVSTPRAVRGPELGKLREAVEHQFKRQSDQEQRARFAMLRIEADLISRLAEFDRNA